MYTRKKLQPECQLPIVGEETGQRTWKFVKDDCASTEAETKALAEPSIAKIPVFGCSEERIESDSKCVLSSDYQVARAECRYTAAREAFREVSRVHSVNELEV